MFKDIFQQQPKPSFERASSFTGSASSWEEASGPPGTTRTSSSTCDGHSCGDPAAHAIGESRDTVEHQPATQSLSESEVYLVRFMKLAAQLIMNTGRHSRRLI